MLLDDDQKLLNDSKFYKEYAIKLRSRAGIQLQQFYSLISSKNIELDINKPAYEISEFIDTVQVVFYWNDPILKDGHIEARHEIYRFVLNMYGYSTAGIEKSKSEFLEKVYNQYLKLKPDYLMV